MVFFQWKDKFKIGVEDIDRQHKSFLDCLNDYYEQLTCRKGAAIDPTLPNDLKSYVTVHFRHEEDLIQMSGYSEIEEHKRQHGYFESQVAELEAAQSAGSGRPPESVLPFLRDWFLNHILERDKELTGHIM